MATFTGNSIFDILTNQFVPNGQHTFNPVNTVNLGQVEVLHFYGSQTVSTSNVNTTYFTDVTSNQDTIMCIRVFHGDLDIQTGVTFRPPHRTKGMFILVKGNLTIGSGSSISMTGRGSSAPGVAVRMWGTQQISASGGSGASSASASATSTITTSYGSGANGANGNNGSVGSNRGTGGGGSGAVHGFAGSGGPFTFTSGAGSAGTSWSGGNGGGGIAAGRNASSSAGNATSETGGSGYSARTTSTGTIRRAGGGAGITAGTGTFTSGTQTVGSGVESSSNNTGAGGLLMIACLGNVTFTNNTSKLLSQGAGDGGLSTTNSAEFLSAGGASGGGSINLLYKTSNQTKTNIEGTNASSNYANAQGGSGTTVTGTVTNFNYSTTSGAGGNGTITVNDFTGDGVTAPVRSLFKVGSTLYYYNFTTSLWSQATGNGTEPFERFGMLNGEMYQIDRSMIQNILSVNLSAVTIQTYVS